MYHFDHPYSLEKRVGGWSKQGMVDEFVKYADFLFTTYGKKVKYWNPVNEGNMLCIFLITRLDTYSVTKTDNSSYYNCIHHTILAQARTYRLYKEKYYKEQKGLVGTSVLVWPGTPATESYEDLVAANTFNDVFGATPVHPLVYGDYPDTAKYLIEKRSKNEMGMTVSRLPKITDEEREILIGKDGEGA
ncbi:hypothetical protein FOCC_FOCC013882 [Frankliniella occidentalis]|nr:hypothetical protein FOCC_FOCC013882 [Frankliniella occidentalis]